MSNLHLTLADLNPQQREDYEYYKNLGFNEYQSLTLAYYTFVETYGRDKEIIKTILKAYDKERNDITFSEYFVTEYKSVVAFLEEQERKRRDTSVNEINLTRGILEKTGNMPLPPSPASYSCSALTGSKKGKSVSYSMNSRSLSCSYAMTEEAAPMMEKRVAPILASTATPGMAFLDALTGGADAQSFEHINEKGFQNVSDSPTSSFKTTCNTASIGMLMNQIRAGRSVKADSVRIEELMNFFDYDIKSTEELFTIHTELADKPHSKNKLLFVGVQGRKEQLGKQNIVLLLDTSGSMCRNDRIMKKTMMTVVANMQEGDTISLITYSDEDHTIFHGLTINKHTIENIIEKMFTICIEGCTNGSAGIETAYKYAADYFISDGVNKVILMTDGDLNFGINDKGGLEKLILKKKKTGVFLSVIGMGLWNFKDDKLETLAKNGNGNYCVINNEWELNEIMNKRYEAIIHTIAKDVKAQVEFNPAKVKSYRLLGYENREISHTEFNDDKVIAEPFCSGSVCVAMYELEMADETVQDAGLKYQTRVLNDSPEYCTVSVRYKLPMAEESILISKPVSEIGNFSDNMKLAFVCYAIGEKFRNSAFNDLKDELFARYIAETMEGELANVNGDKMKLLTELARKSL